MGMTLDLQQNLASAIYHARAKSRLLWIYSGGEAAQCSLRTLRKSAIYHAREATQCSLRTLYKSTFFLKLNNFTQVFRKFALSNINSPPFQQTKIQAS